MGFCLYTDSKYRCHFGAVSKKSDELNLLNDTHVASPSPLAEMAMGWCVILMLRHHETIHTGNFHRKGYLMLHHLAGATIQVANLINYDKKMAITTLVLKKLFIYMSLVTFPIKYLYKIAILNPYKPSVLYVGYRQTVQTQIRRHIKRRLIRVCAVFLQNVQFKLE